MASIGVLPAASLRGEVAATFSVAAELDDGHDVQGAVNAPVARPWQAVPVLVIGRGVQGCGAVPGREVGPAGEPADIPDVAEQPSCTGRTDPVQLRTDRRLAGDENTGRVIRIRRAALKQGTTAESDGEIATNLVYNVPLSQTAGGPYDMNSAAVSTWGQSDLPTDSTAVFVPEEAPARGSATAGVATIPVVSRSCAPRAAQLRYRGSTQASARSANSSASTRCRNVGLRVGLLVKPPP